MPLNDTFVTCLLMDLIKYISISIKAFPWCIPQSISTPTHIHQHALTLANVFHCRNISLNVLVFVKVEKSYNGAKWGEFNFVNIAPTTVHIDIEADYNQCTL